jgi:UDP-N-acetylglucosamine 2-epimerase
MAATHIGRQGPVLLCFGTRPQVIKASVLLTELRRRLPTLAVDTGQHYDYELNALLYEQLNIQKPDHLLDVGSGSHADQTAAILTKMESLLRSVDARAVVVIGDTNSTLGGALAAAKLRIPVVHVEAGLRAADYLLAEEINRRAVDAMSALLCAPSARAAARLRAENLAGRIVVTGDIARDVLVRHSQLPWEPGRTAPAGFRPGVPFALATIHRAELTDSPDRLGRILDALGTLGMPVLLPLHPRTRKVITDSKLQDRIAAHVHISAPLGYLENVTCVREAAIVLTDSGGVQREAYWLGTPCVTLRAETEWMETLDCGANVVISPDDAHQLPQVAGRQIRNDRQWDRDLLGTGTTGIQIANLVSETWGA